jgi:hypothetical protein
MKRGARPVARGAPLSTRRNQASFLAARLLVYGWKCELVPCLGNIKGYPTEIVHTEGATPWRLPSRNVSAVAVLPFCIDPCIDTSDQIRHAAIGQHDLKGGHWTTTFLG